MSNLTKFKIYVKFYVDTNTTYNLHVTRSCKREPQTKITEAWQKIDRRCVAYVSCYVVILLTYNLYVTVTNVRPKRNKTRQKLAIVALCLRNVLRKLT